MVKLTSAGILPERRMDGEAHLGRNPAPVRTVVGGIHLEYIIAGLQISVHGTSESLRMHLGPCLVEIHQYITVRGMCRIDVVQVGKIE